MARRIYLASSWRNERYPAVVQALRAAGHELFDWRHPTPDARGFHWSELDLTRQGWTPAQFRALLTHPVARRGFACDYAGMGWADTGVLLLPAGRSAHLEAGWFAGTGRPLFVLLAPGEPELMYCLAQRLCVDLDELLEALQEADA